MSRFRIESTSKIGPGRRISTTSVTQDNAASEGDGDCVMGIENTSSNTRKRLRLRVTEKKSNEGEDRIHTSCIHTEGERSKVRTKSMSRMGRVVRRQRRRKEARKLRGRLDQENANKV